MNPISFIFQDVFAKHLFMQLLAFKPKNSD